MAPLPQWQENILFLSIIYSVLEKGHKLRLRLEGEDVFCQPILDDMARKGLAKPNEETNLWEITPAGDALRGKMVAMYDQLLKFEIFGQVNQALQLTEEQSPDGMKAYDSILDPRFAPTPQSEDLRLAMLAWYGTAAAEQLGGKQVDPYQVVFMQRLRAGKYNGQFFWADLRMGRVFQEIEKIVDSAVKWTQLGGDETESSNVMSFIYSAGMSEQIKRDGARCSCGAYLGMFDYYAAKEGKTVDECPACEKSFKDKVVQGTTPTTVQECPNCGSELSPHQRRCPGCHATIDRSMAAGTVETTTTVTEETVYDYGYADYYNPWGSPYVSYGYAPPPVLYPGVYYDPFDPVASVIAFGLLCAIL